MEHIVGCEGTGNSPRLLFVLIVVIGVSISVSNVGAGYRILTKASSFGSGEDGDDVDDLHCVGVL